MKNGGILTITAAVALLALGACTGMDGMSGGTAAKPAPKDGELAVDMGYKSWPVFLANIDKEQAKQVRDIYINTIGAKTMAGKDFPNGTVMVMEIYKARENMDGTLEKGPDGKLVKGALAKVFTMTKGEGWGQMVPDTLKNGSWVYSASGPDGKLLAEDFTKCRACHAPLMQKDFVHRYDEYFEKRGKS